jgi:hypothetical protein
MRILPCVALTGLLCAAGAADADTGLKVDAVGGFWSGAQTNVRLNAARQETSPLQLGYQATTGLYGPAPLAATLAVDYYFSKDIADARQPDTGFRATSALLIRQPGVSLSDLAWSSRSSASFGVPMHLALPSVAPAVSDPSAYGFSTMPYLGIGYSDISLKSGWGFWADIGLVVQSPGGALGLGRVLSGTQGVDELMRELRMSPLVQLGVNYSF